MVKSYPYFVSRLSIVIFFSRRDCLGFKKMQDGVYREEDRFTASVIELIATSVNPATMNPPAPAG
jgi:hypothetical protein